MFVRLKNLELLNTFYKENFTTIYSSILDILNLTVFEHFGEVISFDYNEIFCLWENTSNNKIRQCKSLKNDNFEECIVSLNLVDINKSFISQESIEEQYEDYEVGKYKLDNILELGHQKTISEKINGENYPKNVYNLAVISAIKLLSRLNYNPYIKETLKPLNIQNLGIEIVIHRGNSYRMIINTDYKIENRYIGRCFSKVRYISKMAKDYKIPVIVTEEIVKKICPQFFSYTREIFSIEKDDNLFDQRLSILSFETIFKQDSILANYYYENMKITKDTSKLMKNEYTKMINSDNLDMDSLLKNDSELLFSLSKSSLTFLRFYRESYQLYKTHQFEKAKKILHTAMLFKSDDYKSIKLMEECDEKINNRDLTSDSSSEESIISS